MSNLNLLKKSDLIVLVEQLKRNAEDDRRRIGVMMYEQNVMTQRIIQLEAELEGVVDDADEIDRLTDIVKTQAARIKLLSQKVAAQPKSAPVQATSKPAPVSAEVELAPVVNITDADKAIWSKFQRLSREERMTIINWARPQFGHVGINNIIQVRAAWHEFQAAA